MSYYAVLEATNALVARHQWTLKRCRRRCDGPARYLVVDHVGSRVLIDKANKARRLGFTLPELLMCLREQCEADVAAAADNLLQQLNTLTEQEY